MPSSVLYAYVRRVGGVICLPLYLFATTTAADTPSVAPFTALDERGQPTEPKGGRTPHPCVRANRTGQVWEVKTDDGDLRDQVWTYSWYNTDSNSNGGGEGKSDGGICGTTGRCDTQKYVEDVNAETLCGFSDWRLPSIEELKSIVDDTRADPAIDPVYFPNTPGKFFWTSYVSPKSKRGAWFIDFMNGNPSDCFKSSSYNVRLVRGELRR